MAFLAMFEELEAGDSVVYQYQLRNITLSDKKFTSGNLGDGEC